jgi:hypothetical protein
LIRPAPDKVSLEDKKACQAGRSKTKEAGRHHVTLAVPGISRGLPNDRLFLFDLENCLMKRNVG